MSAFERFLILLLATSLGACAVAGYGVDPKAAWSAERLQIRSDAEVSYRIRDPRGITLSGRGGLMASFKKANPFPKAEPAPNKEGEGLHIDVLADNKTIAVGELVWGYIALSTLFVLPAYSGASGFYMQYTVYEDGERIGYYEYVIKRRVFAWLPVLPFVWINALTTSERDAFEATTRQFFRDAEADGLFRQALSARL